MDLRQQRAVNAAMAAVLTKKREKAAAGRWLTLISMAGLLLAAGGAWATGVVTDQTLCSLALVAAAFPLIVAVLFTLLSFVVGKPFTARASSYFVPKAMRRIDALLGNVREELLKNLSGAVLDVGCADGSSYLKYYAAAGANVTKIVFLEPNAFHHAALLRNVTKTQALGDVEVVVEGRSIFELDVTAATLEARGRRRQRTPLAKKQGSRSRSRSRSSRGRAVDPSAGTGAGFDWVILGNVLCEVPDPVAVVAHIDRLLKPGGKVYFSEHVAHPTGTWARALQDAVNPWWCVVSDGCHCNRPTTWMQQFGHGHGVEGKGKRKVQWDVRQWAVDVNLLAPFVIGVATKPYL